MKSKLLGLLVLLPLGAPASATDHKGKFYVGAGVGRTYLNSTVYQTSERAGNVSGAFVKLGKSSLAGQLQAGYHKNFSKAFVSGELFSLFTNNKASAISLGHQLYAGLTKTRTIGLSGKIGVPVHENWGVFASGSILNANFKFDITDTSGIPDPTQSVTKKNSAWGIAPGLGVLYTVSNISIGLAYRYEMYQNLRANTSDGWVDNPQCNTAKVSPRYHTAMLSLSYGF